MNNLCNFILIVSFFLYANFSTNHIFAQDISRAEIDSIINSGDEFSMNDRQKNIPILIRIDSLSKTINYAEGMVYANIGLAYNHMSNDPMLPLKYISVLDSLLQNNRSSFSDTTLIHYFLFKGSNLGQRDNKIDELNYYLKADSFATAIKNDFLLKDINQYICKYYLNLEEYQMALKYNHNLLSYLKKNTNPTDEFYYLLSLRERGAIHLKMEKPDSCIYYISASIEKGLANYTDLIYSHLLLGNAHLMKENLEQAIFYGNLITEQTNPHIPKRLIVVIQLFLGNLNSKLGHLEKTRNHFESAYNLSDSIGDSDKLLIASYKLLHTDLRIKQDSISIHNLETYKLIRDSLNDTAVNKYKHQLLVQYETEKKKVEIAQLKYDIQVNRSTKFGIIICSIILLMIALFIIYKNKIKRKILNQQLEIEKQDKEISNSKLNNTIEKLKSKNDIIEQLKIDLVQPSDVESLALITSALDKNYIFDNNWTEIIFHFDLLYDNFTK